MSPIALKSALTVLAVLLPAAATIALALRVAGDVMPWWMAALGPVLLGLTLWAHWRGRRP